MEGFVQQLEEMKKMHNTQLDELAELQQEFLRKETQCQKLSVLALTKQKEMYLRKQQDNELKIAIIQRRLQCDELKRAHIKQANHRNIDLTKRLQVLQARAKRFESIVHTYKKTRIEQRNRCDAWLKNCNLARRVAEIQKKLEEREQRKSPDTFMERRKAELRSQIQAASDRLSRTLEENSALQDQLDQFESLA